MYFLLLATSLVVGIAIGVWEVWEVGPGQQQYYECLSISPQAVSGAQSQPGFVSDQ